MPPAYPALAGNRVLTMDPAVNAIRIVLHGGFPPGTAGNPRPYGMPPYGHQLDDDQVAAVVSYLRASWGNAAAPVSTVEVNRYRSVPLD
jgi:mono/diheme cytochrome c family protein